ncbi:MAG: alanine racemase, partial [Pseudomonadota bacterium]
DLRKIYPDIELHLIGSLQSNKVKTALKLFDVIQTIDRKSLVDTIIKESVKQDDIRCNRFFIQVNIGEEPQKGGVFPENFNDLLEYIDKKINITGLMCVPPTDFPPAPHFALVHKLAKENSLHDLSMGMSDDYETAIRFGANFVRIGTALFGARN